MANEPNNVVPGRLDLSGRRPRLELGGALFAFMKEVPSAPGVSAFVEADDPPDSTVHGVLMGSVRSVTVFNARRLRLNAAVMSIMSARPNEGLQEEVLEGDYAVLGAHVADGEEFFDAFDFRLRHQDAWAEHSGLSMKVDTTGKRRVTFEYVNPDAVLVPLADDAGTLSLDAEASVSPLRVGGAYVDTRTRLKVMLNTPISIHDAWVRFVIPASSLLTMLNAKECPPIAFRVRSATQRWCTVHIAGLGIDTSDVRSTKLPEAPLMSRRQLGLERLAAWFELAERLTPLPQLIAGAFEASDRSVQNLLLELATAAEGLHRKLYPDARKLSKEQRDTGLEAVADLDIDRDTKQALHTALKLYLWEPSFPQRLKVLAEDVVVAAPDVTGKTNRWRDAVRDARNGFAHDPTSPPSSNDAIFGYHVLQMSLRWVLTARLLLELGVAPAELAARFSKYRRYEQFLKNAARDLPRVYGSSAG